jgi:hypothetical protein
MDRKFHVQTVGHMNCRVLTCGRQFCPEVCALVMWQVTHV